MRSDPGSRVVALAEVVALVVVALATRLVLGQRWPGVAAGALSIGILLALATWLLWRRGASWRELGCRRPQELGTAAAWTAALFVADMLLIPLITAVVGNALGWPSQQLEAFAGLRGNLARYLVLLLPISWGTAAFGEELLFRGFLARRLSDAFGATRLAEVAANLGQAALFGLGHAYLGPRGMLNAAALGLTAGLAYRWGGRNLWPLFIAHGLVDSVGITALYLGAAHA